jgi:hypothetical protein
MSANVDTQGLHEHFAEAAGAKAAPSRQQPAARFSLRLTPQERQTLNELAGNQSLGQYIRSRLLGEATKMRRSVRRPSADAAKLALVLAELGKSLLASNINQLAKAAKAANTGNLPVSAEVEKQLETACAEIQAMRMLLVTALGIESEADE